MRNYNSYHEEEKGNPANVPMQHYSQDDVIELVRQPSRPASMRRALPGINCPDNTSTWDDIHAFRAKWNLPPVSR